MTHWALGENLNLTTNFTSYHLLYHYVTWPDLTLDIKILWSHHSIVIYSMPKIPKKLFNSTVFCSLWVTSIQFCSRWRIPWLRWVWNWITKPSTDSCLRLYEGSWNMSIQLCRSELLSALKSSQTLGLAGCWGFWASKYQKTNMLTLLILGMLR